MSKDEKCTCKACKDTVFHCQICKFVGSCCRRRRGCVRSQVSLESPRLEITSLIENFFQFSLSFVFYHFPFFFAEKAEKYDTTGSKIYLQTCRFLDVTPVSFFLKNIHEERLDLKHRLLGPKGGKALAVALEVCTVSIQL